MPGKETFITVFIKETQVPSVTSFQGRRFWTIEIIKGNLMLFQCDLIYYLGG